MLRPAPRFARLRAGFTLIELLAVMLIIGILMAFLVPQIPAAIDRANVTACKSNLREIGSGMLEYHMKYKRFPKESGARFVTSLVTDKVWDNTESSAKRLTCPAIETSSLGGLVDVPPAEWYADKEIIDGSFTSYAGRNMKDYAFRKFPTKGSEAMVADDNDPDGNHRTATVVLWGDNSVRELELVTGQDEGLVGAEEEFIVVGPESPYEALQKLSLD